MNIEIPHNLGKVEALQRISTLLESLKEKHSDKISNLKEDWQDNTGNFSCSIGPVSAAGNITVDEDKVNIAVELPFFASMFKGQIQTLIEEEAKKVLS